MIKQDCFFAFSLMMFCLLTAWFDIGLSAGFHYFIAGMMFGLICINIRIRA